MSKIKAAVCHQFTASLQIETVELRSPLPNEIEVQLGAVAICHSDIAFAEGLWGGGLPAVYGHEAAGVVTQVGASVRGISVGDHVVVTLIRACGHCLSCAAGQPTSCETPQDPSASPLQYQGGQTLHQGMACGAFAEKVVVDASQVVQIPAELPFEVACLLACGVITGVGAVVHSAQLRAGQDVVVIGAG
ncbi:MAG: alcohol dehydrogenase catalytic domain-containing protein, partial [Deltaproteobacteria bacterium]